MQQPVLAEQEIIPVRLASFEFPQIEPHRKKRRYRQFQPRPVVESSLDTAPLNSPYSWQNEIAEMHTAGDERPHSGFSGSFIGSGEIVQEVVAALVKGRSGAPQVAQNRAIIVYQSRPVVRVLDFMADVTSGGKAEPEAKTITVANPNIAGLAVRRWRAQP